jgi:hypothetical protein
MNDAIIKVGYLVSYDWKLLEHSIPRIYSEADTITLALDKNRKTWAGNLFEFDEAGFHKLITRLDTQKKITLYQDNFFDSSLSTMQNEVRERTMLANQMGKGGWHIQLDADEYLLDFSAFVQGLKRIDTYPNPETIKKPVNVTGNWITIIKKVPSGYLYIKPDTTNLELCVLATQVPCYQHGRGNGYFNIKSNLFIVHESRSRSDEEFYFKLKNWGHNQDFNTDSYFAIWKAIDEHNYKYIKDFNPTGKGVWPEIAFAPAKNIDELIEFFKSDKTLKLSAFQLFLMNSRNLARIRQLFNYALKYLSRIFKNSSSQ